MARYRLAVRPGIPGPAVWAGIPGPAVWPGIPGPAVWAGIPGPAGWAGIANLSIYIYERKALLYRLAEVIVVARRILKTLWGKEKMLKISIFEFKKKQSNHEFPKISSANLGQLFGRF